MSERRGIKLPADILREIGISPKEFTGTFRKPRYPESGRKATRKAARIEKRKQPISQGRKILKRPQATARPISNDNGHSSSEGKELKSSGKPVVESKQVITSSKSSKSKGSNHILAAEDEPKQARLDRKVRDKLAEDDEEIAILERRLGLKGKKKLPKSFEEDGLGDLLEDLGDNHLEDHDEPQRKKSRLSREEEAWLSDKRRKATAHLDDVLSPNSDSGDEESVLDGKVVDSKSDDFEEFDDHEIGSTSQPRQRENPYVAPQTSNITKYIPPSLRVPESTDIELMGRLRRQIQGTLNRLSEAKVLSIAADIEKIYQENPRQYVSTLILDTLFTLVCDPSPLQDTFMILHGGFVAALYKTIGTEFGAQVIQRFVEEYDKLSLLGSDSIGKRLSNLVTFLAELYNFQVIGSSIIYDMIRKLTTDLSEDNAELLLRVARISGSQLRQDDSESLKDIVTLLHASVEKYGLQNLSVRTKFMIETIENLKNSKLKTGIAASNMRIEHTIAMKKTLGSIDRSRTRTNEPLRISLEDIRSSDKKGKWWLVGASYKHTREPSAIPLIFGGKQIKERSEESSEIDLDQLAREQGMNTEIRRAIFISIVSSYDYKEACTRLTKLGMKSKQRLEIPRVVVHCVGAEKKYYNRFYTKIAKHLCKERNIRKAFSFALWDVFKRLEDDEEVDDGSGLGQLDTTAMVYIAKMYGELVADGIQSILLLKHLDLTHPSSKAKTFAEVFLITVFQYLSRESDDVANKVKKTLATVEQAPEMIVSLQLFLRKSVRSTKLVQDPKDMERIKKCCKAAETVLLELISNGIGRGELTDLII